MKITYDNEQINKLLDKWCNTPNWMPVTQLELNVIIGEAYMTGKEAAKRQAK